MTKREGIKEELGIKQKELRQRKKTKAQQKGRRSEVCDKGLN